MKPERYDLIPVEAMASVARLYGVGAKKYAEHNWRRGYDWSKSYAALQRHANAFWNGEDYDPEFTDFPSPHLAGVIFHALALITFMEEQRPYDDRYVGPKTEAEQILSDIQAHHVSAADVRKKLGIPVITSND